MDILFDEIGLSDALRPSKFNAGNRTCRWRWPVPIESGRMDPCTWTQDYEKFTDEGVSECQLTGDLEVNQDIVCKLSHRSSRSGITKNMY